MKHANGGDVVSGKVSWSPVKSLWWTVMAVTTIAGGAATFSWSAFALFLVATGLVLLFGHSLGSHRKLIHNSYQCPKWLEYLFVYAGVQVGLAGPLGLLRQHDLRDFAQRQPDCHDFLRHGKSFWTDGWWQLHCDLELNDPPQLMLEAGIIHDRFYRFLERTWMLQQLPPALTLFWFGGWGFVVWGVCARITAGVLGHWLVGYFAHNYGGMHQEVRGAAVQGHNIRLTSLLTMGESWHNNHHAFPGSARLGLYPGEWDPGWWMLVLLSKLGLVWAIKLPKDLPARPELQALNHFLPPGSNAPPCQLAHVREVFDIAAAQVLNRRLICALEAPCASISRQHLQGIAGRRTIVTNDPGLSRLQLRRGNLTVRGLPALALAVGSRNLFTAITALWFLPFACVVESLRCRFELHG
jgi:fatty-acid desaturase